MTNENFYAHIIGIGNLTRMDDGIAIKIIQELQQRNMPFNIKVSDLGTGGIDIILALEGWKKGIIIDAIDIPKLKPGEIIEFNVTKNSIPEINGLSSSHGIDALAALKLAYTLDEYTLPEEIIIIGIQIKTYEGIGTEISKEVLEAIPKVLTKIEEILGISIKKI